MELNCEQAVEKYLLNKNPLYAFSFPLSMIVAIVIFGFAKAYKWSDNSYVNQILIPILALLLTMVIIDLISRNMISNEEKIKLINKCKLWTHDPSVKNHPFLSKKIDMDLVSKYNRENFTAEHFTIQDNSFNNNMPNPNSIREQIITPSINQDAEIDNLMSPVAEINNFNPFPLESAKYNGECIEDSNCCNLCSGSKNSNPCNVVAPIPGPQWLPQSAESVQKRLVKNNYTEARCNFKEK